MKQSGLRGRFGLSLIVSVGIHLLIGVIMVWAGWALRSEPESRLDPNRSVLVVDLSRDLVVLAPDEGRAGGGTTPGRPSSDSIVSGRKRQKPMEARRISEGAAEGRSDAPGERSLTAPAQARRPAGSSVCCADHSPEGSGPLPFEAALLRGDVGENVAAKTAPRPRPAPVRDRAPGAKSPGRNGAQVSVDGIDHAGPSFAAREESMARFLGEVRRRLEGAKRYPWVSRLHKQEGTLRLQFWVSGLGEVGEIRLLESSGWEILDREGLELARRAGRFPRLPDPWREGVRLEVPIVFELDKDGR